MMPTDQYNEQRLAELLRLIDESGESPQDLSESDLRQSFEDLSADQQRELVKAHACLQRLGEVGNFEQAGTVGSNRKTLVNGRTENNFEAFGGISKSFGRYQIRKLIGEGGFARVFLAHDPVLSRDIALKIPGPQALATEESRARFEREGKAAGTLNHPAIVTVFEAGTVGPIPYIAMAYCQGTSLGQCIDKHAPFAPELAARIAKSLAEGLAHAHQRGIVHRDIKPGNVLVDQSESRDLATLPDYVRITDFGLVKYELNGPEELTMDGNILGTPAYMSPEQARGESKVGAASDLFSLGSVLYQLLTGQLPHKKETALKTLASIEEKEPASLRSHDNSIPRDLEAITLKCLRKEPQKRYQSAFDLVQDLDRWLVGKPVAARRITSLERLWSSAKRNPMTTVALTFAFFSLLVGLIVATWQWKIADSRNQMYVEANREAVFKSKRATESLQTLLNSFETVDPFQSGGKGKAGIEVLRRAKQDVEEKFAEDTESKLELLSALAKSFTGMGDFANATDCRLQCLEISKAEFGESDSRTLVALRELAVAHHNSGEFLKSLDLRREHVELAKKYLGDEHSETINSLNGLGRTYLEMGHIRKAVDLQEQTSLLAELAQDPKAISLDVSTNLAAAYKKAGLLKQAIEINELELKECERLLGPKHPDTIAVKAALSGSLFRGSRRRAKRLMLEVVDDSTQTLGEDDPVTLNYQFMLSKFQFIGRKNKEESFATIAKLIELASQRLTAIHPNVVLYRERQAEMHRDVGELEEAIAIYEPLLEEARNELGEQDYRTIRVMVGLSVSYRRSGRLDDAIELAELAVKSLVERVGDRHLLTVEAMLVLGRCYYAAYRVEEAMELFQDNLDVLMLELPNGHAKVKVARRLYLFTLLQSEDYEAVIRESEIDWDSYHDHHWVSPASLNIGALAHWNMGQAQEAEKLLKPLLQTRSVRFPASYLAKGTMSCIHLEREQFEMAKEVMIPALDALVDQFDQLPFPHQRSAVLQFVDKAIVLHQVCGDVEEAKEWGIVKRELTKAVEAIKGNSKY